VIVTDNFILLATPRTASRTLEACVMQVADIHPTKTDKHHTKAAEVLATISRRPEVPVYTMLRNPLTQVVSWWKHAQKPVDIETFIKKYRNGWLFNGRLNIYEGQFCKDTVQIKHMLFEDGVPAALEVLGLSLYDIDIPHIGKTDESTPAFDESLVYARFPKDIELYNSYLNFQEQLCHLTQHRSK
jgi:hypothetical protein